MCRIVRIWWDMQPVAVGTAWEWGYAPNLWPSSVGFSQNYILVVSHNCPTNIDDWYQYRWLKTKQFFLVPAGAIRNSCPNDMLYVDDHIPLRRFADLIQILSLLQVWKLHLGRFNKLKEMSELNKLKLAQRNPVQVKLPMLEDSSWLYKLTVQSQSWHKNVWLLHHAGRCSLQEWNDPSHLFSAIDLDLQLHSYRYCICSACSLQDPYFRPVAECITLTKMERCWTEDYHTGPDEGLAAKWSEGTETFSKPTLLLKRGGTNVLIGMYMVGFKNSRHTGNRW